MNEQKTITLKDGPHAGSIMDIPENIMCLDILNEEGNKEKYETSDGVNFYCGRDCETKSFTLNIGGVEYEPCGIRLQ